MHTTHRCGYGSDDNLKWQALVYYRV
jgi:hypothetical protein